MIAILIVILIMKGLDQIVRIFEMNGEERQSFRGHHGSVECVRFNPLHDMIVSG